MHWLLIMGTYIWGTVAPSNSGKMQEGRETWDLRRGITNLDRVLKSRDITLLTKVCMVKAMVFPVVVYGYESWTLKKAGCWRIYAFKLWCWRRFLWVPWTAKRSNQWILKENNSKYSLEGLILKLKLQYFGHLMQRADSLEKTLILPSERLKSGGEGQDTKDETVGWHHRLNGHEFEQAPGDGDGQANRACGSPWGRKELDTTERLNNNNIQKPGLSRWH